MKYIPSIDNLGICVARNILHTHFIQSIASIVLKLTEKYVCSFLRHFTM